MKIYIKNKIFITEYEEIPPEIMRQIKSELTFDNPEYITKVKRNLWIGKTPKYIWLYNMQNNGKNQWLELPRGYYNRLIQLLKSYRYGLQWEIIDKRLELDKIEIESKITLRDYQIEPVDKITNVNQGGLIAVCGAGKTNMAIELMCRVKQPTLWICHTKELLNQTITRMLATTTLTKEEIGIISEGKIEIGRKVTIGLIGTLCKRDMKDIQSKFGCIILDEAHHLPANTFYDVITQFDAKYRYYVTATPEREDGLTDVLTYEMGAAVARITLDDIKDSIIIPKLTLVKTDFYSTSAEYHDLMQDLCNDNARNEQIKNTVIERLKADRSILLLSDRVEHLLIIKTLLRGYNDRLKIEILSGTTPKKEREEIMKRAQNYDVDVLLATKLAREGLDITHLDCLILATPKKAKGAVVQEVGRIMRACEGKRYAEVIDFVDDKMGIFKNQYWKRREAYKELKMI